MHSPLPTSSRRSSRCAERYASLRTSQRVTFMDSTALGVIVRSVRELAQEGAHVQVVLPVGSARRIFEITTLDRALPDRRDAQAALTALEA